MSINQDRIRLFETNLKSAFKATQILIEDESHLHVGHTGATSGCGHFRLTIISSEFEGLNKVARHRAVYTALNTPFSNAIHALTIKAIAPSEITG